MDADTNPAMPAELRDGDVLVYMEGRLLVVDHIVPEAFAIDLVESHEDDATHFRENIDVSRLQRRRD